MTTGVPAVPDARPAPPDRPRPGPGVRAELVETPAGWTLTLTLDAVSRSRLRAALDAPAGAIELEPADLRLSVTPNLVPGVPFTVTRVAVVQE